MFLVKNPNGRYYVVYEKPNGKRTSISTKTKNKSEAYKFLSNFNNELKKKLSEKVILIDLKQFFFEFLKHSESIHSWNTTKSIISTKKAILKYFGNVQLTDVTKPKIIEYLDFRIRTASIYVGRRELAYLSGAFNWAISRNYLNDNPTKGIKRFRVPEKQPLFYSIGDIEELLNVIDNTDIQDLINFALHTGLRQMELLNLEWNQIDFVNRNVFLNNINHMTKSQKIRTIPLDSKAFEILIKRGKGDRNIKVFTINNEPIKQQFISHKMKKYIKKAGLNPNLNFHSLRHTFASWLVQKGADINRVSKLLGHADIKTTEIYAHLRPEDLRNTVSLLDN